MKITLSRILCTLLLSACCTAAVAKEATTAFLQPVEPVLLVGDQFERTEGIAFGEGEFDHQLIYVTTTFNGGRGGNIWRVPVGIEGVRLNR